MNPMSMATVGAVLMTNSLWRVFPRDGMHFDMDQHASEHQLGLSLIFAVVNFFCALFPLWWIGALKMCCFQTDDLLRGLIRRLPSESVNRWCPLQRLLHVCAIMFFMGWCLLVIVLVPWIRYDLNDVCVPYHEYIQDYPFEWALLFPELGIPERVAEEHGLHPTLLPAFSALAQATPPAPSIGVQQVVAGQCASPVAEFETHFAWPRQFMPAIEGSRVRARYGADSTYGSVDLPRHLLRTTRLQCDQYVNAVEWLDFARHDLSGYSLYGKELLLHRRSTSGEDVEVAMHSFNPYGGPGNATCDEFAEEYMGGCREPVRFDAPSGHAVVGFLWSDDGTLTGVETLPLSMEAAGYTAFGANCFEDSADEGTRSFIRSGLTRLPDASSDGLEAEIEEIDETVEQCEQFCTANAACSAFNWIPSAETNKCELKMEADGDAARVTIPQVPQSGLTCYAKKRATCSAALCVRGRTLKYEHELPEECAGTVCARDECCDNGGTCEATFTANCSAGLLPKLFPPRRCGNRDCSERECCEAAPTCSQSSCDLWHTVKNFPPPYCEGRSCTSDECCSEADSCDEKHCLAVNGTLKTSQITYCLALSCTPEDCCDFPDDRRLDLVEGEEAGLGNLTDDQDIYGIVTSRDDDIEHAEQLDRQANSCTDGCKGDGTSYNGMLIIDLKTIQAVKASHFASLTNATAVEKETGKKLRVLDVSFSSSDKKLIPAFNGRSENRRLPEDVTQKSSSKSMGSRLSAGMNDMTSGIVSDGEVVNTNDDDHRWEQDSNDRRRLDDPSSGPGGMGSSGGSASTGPGGSVSTDSAGIVGNSGSAPSTGGTSGAGMNDGPGALAFIQALSGEQQEEASECYLVAGDEVCGVGACHCSPMAELLCMQPPDLVALNESFDLDGCIMVKRPMCSRDSELTSGAFAPAHFLAWTSAVFCLILFLNQIVLTAAHLERTWARLGPMVGLSEQEVPEKEPESRLNFQRFTVVFWIDPDEWCFPKMRRSPAFLWLDRLLPAAWRCSMDFRLGNSRDVDARLVMDLLLTRRPESLGTEQARADLKDLCSIASDLRSMAPSPVELRPRGVAFHIDAQAS